MAGRATWPRGAPRSAARRRSGDTREGFAQHLRWERRLFADRWAVGVVAGRATAAGARRCGSGCSSRRSTTGPARRQRVTQNGIFLLAPTVFEFGTPEQQDQHPAAAWPPADDLWCQGWSEPNAGSDLAERHEQGAAGRRRLGARRPEDVDHPGRVLHPPVRAVPHRPRQRAAQGPHLPARPARHARASPCAASAASTATRASPRCSSTTPSSPTTRCPAGSCSARRGQGWAVAMATAGSERGLTLRSPGRFLATAERLARPVPAERATPTPAPARRRRVDAGRGLPAADARRPSPSLATAAPSRAPRPASTSSGGASSTSSCTRSPSTCSARGRARRARGRRAGSSRCRARSTPAPTRSSATSPPSALLGLPRTMSVRALRLDDDQLAFRDAVRDLLAKECPPAGRCGPRGTAPRRRARPRACGTRLAAMGVLVAARARGRRRPRPRRVLARADPRGGGPGRAPAPDRRDGDGGRARCSGVDARRHGRHRPRRARSCRALADADALLLRRPAAGSLLAATAARSTLEPVDDRRPGPASRRRVRHDWRRPRHRRRRADRAGARPRRPRHRGACSSGSARRCST